MVAQLLQPPCDVLVCLVLADIVDKQRSYGASVVGRGNGAVSLLACGIPDLSFDGLRVDLESRLNSLRVNRLNRLDLPTPESPMRTTAGG
jgi:hypothetical protein